MQKELIRIVIVDSGICEHKAISKEISCFEVVSIDGQYNVVESKKEDNIGHGTAVSFIISHNLDNVEILSIKIYDDDTCDPEKLIFVLDYIYEHIKCDLINISLGTTCCSSITKLRESCKKLTNEGVVIISAFDNNGTLSYPAAFENVIGVDAGFINGNIKDYIYVENSPVNIIGCQREQRLPWKDNKYQIVSGASFITPYITVRVADLISNGYKSLTQIIDGLKETSCNTITYNSINTVKKIVPKKAIVFPFNKEIHSLARYKTMANFSIAGFYDIKYIGNVGRKIGDVIGSLDDTTINNYLDIDWNDNFDTIVLGHIKELSNLINMDLMTYFVDFAIRYKKQIISFDPIDGYNAEMLNKNKIVHYHPTVTVQDVPANCFNKLRKIGKPTIAIVGSGPRQGKFTLQMMLKSIFEDSDYCVGMLGTEPTAMLLGSDEVYPMGYNSSVDVKGIDAIKVINQMMGRIEDKDPDLIIVGSQSQSVPFTDGSIKYLPLAQHEFLLATAPDAYILCINLSDNLAYIKRTVKYLESIYGSCVLALAALPFDHSQKWSVISNKKIKLSEKEISDRIDNIKQELGLDVYIITNERDNIVLAEKIVDFFS